MTYWQGHLTNNRRTCVPAGPVLELVDDWLTRRGQTGAATGERLHTTILSPMEILQLRTGYKDIHATLRRLRHQTWLTHAVADKLLCAIDRVEAWQSIPELREAYYYARLAA